MKKNVCMIIVLFAVEIIFIFPIHLDAATQQMADYTGQVFPADNALNMPIDSLPVHSNSDNYINSIGRNTTLHPDFGTAWDDGNTLRPMGIPYNVVGAGQPKVPITFVLYDDESDPGPWPIPTNPFIETVFDWRDLTEGDRHMLIVDSSSHILYETGGTKGNSDGKKWEGGCGAVFDLDSHKLRPDTWTSADAAGLPIFPLLIRYDEVSRAVANNKEIPHAIRFTVQNTQKSYIWPARHFASSSTDKNRPPMGLRFRLKANVNISGFSSPMQVILRTMKKYGMIVSDNGGNWFFQGTHDDRWDDEEIGTLKSLHGSDFEAVDINPWMTRPGFDSNSGKVPAASGATISLPFDIKNSQNFLILQNSSDPLISSINAIFFLTNETPVSIKIYDVIGHMIRTLAESYETAGMHTIQWDKKNSLGQYIGKGVYFFQLKCAKGFVSTKKYINR
jgi:hypothetical protein